MSITTAEHNSLSGADLHVAGYVQATDPGAVGAGKLWIDTSGGTGLWVAKVRNTANTGWESTSGAAASHPNLATHDAMGLATDAELAAHAAAADPHAGYRLESADHSHASSGLQGGTVAHSALTGLTTGDPHTQYQQESEKAAANGYASLDAGTKVPLAQIPTGTTSSTVALGDAPAAAVTAHAAAGDPHPAYSLDSDLTAHAAAADPHAGYRLESADHSHASSGMQGGLIAGVGMTEDIEFVIDGGGAVITTGIKGDLGIDFACNIVQWTLLGDQTGSIVVDIWKDTYANFPPVVGDVITASAKPTITTATKGQSSTLTGWTTAIAAGDILRFNVNSVTSLTRCTLVLKVTRT